MAICTDYYERAPLKSVLTLLIIVITACSCGSNRSGSDAVIIHEASGIARSGDRLLIVGDDAVGRYFSMEIEDIGESIIPIDPKKVKEIRMENAELAMDLESIDVFQDGRIAVLSEHLRCLIAQTIPRRSGYSILAEYNKLFTEIGNRGLEGLAIKPLSKSDSQIAILWEGGYPEYDMIPLDLREQIGRRPMTPTIIIHRFQYENTEDYRSFRNVDAIIPLKVELPEGEVPFAQRFRGGDLVWHQWNLDNNGGRPPQEGFIVLLSSSNSPPSASGVPRSFKMKILQRFDLKGEPVGELFDINPFAKQCLTRYLEKHQHLHTEMTDHLKKVKSKLDKNRWEDLNWEGLDWFEEGRSLIMIFDKQSLDPPFALIVPLPDTWR